MIPEEGILFIIYYGLTRVKPGQAASYTNKQIITNQHVHVSYGIVPLTNPNFRHIVHLSKPIMFY